MPKARKHLVCVSDTPYYHITSRCVRRAFLCGVDDVTGRTYEHRRSWIEDRVRVLSSLFSIEICAYAIMSNHYHLIVKLNSEEPNDWSDDEVLKRWTAIFRGPILVQRCRAGELLTPPECDSVRSMTKIFRNRLGSLSWFMKCLNEPIARQANAEDQCTGHFWEARFDSQPLRSERALLTAMAYVDLNPIRAKIATSPERSDFTSIKVRLNENAGDVTLVEAITRMLKRGELHHFDTPIRPLKRFMDEPGNRPSIVIANDGLPIRKIEYLKLVDATGRIIARGKRGFIDAKLEPIVLRLGVSAEQWMHASTALKSHFRQGDLQFRQSS